MSATAIPLVRRPRTVRVAHPEESAPARPQLRLVASPHAGHGRIAYLVTCVSVIVIALIAVLMLNIQMDTGAFTANTLQSQLANLNQRQQQLVQDLSAANSPYQLAQKAQKLGMAPAPTTAFLSLKNGTVSPAQTAAPQ